ncbi:MAG TPA: DUF3558 family protein [Acidimicrobiales bacterium]|jgi:hypothetical protein
MPRRLAASLLVAALALAACSGDGDSDGDGGDGGTAAGETSSSSATTEATSTSAAAGDAAVPASACELVPTDAVNEATGLTLGPGADIGDERRAVCAFNATESGGVGVTVGIEAGGRFDEKAESSRNALGVDGEAVEDLGDEALFFYSDEDAPEGLGGVLVGIGELTVDVTVQGAGDEDATREASVAIARMAAEEL